MRSTSAAWRAQVSRLGIETLHGHFAAARSKLQEDPRLLDPQIAERMLKDQDLSGKSDLF
jgi:hypothetical protein